MQPSRVRGSFAHGSILWCSRRSLLKGAALALIVPPALLGASRANAADDPRLAQAVAWATQQLASPTIWLDSDGVTLCGKFTEAAFGTTAQYPTAYAMYLALGAKADPAQHTLAGLATAPAGTIVFFDRTAANYQAGHAGIYTGDGQFIGVVSKGRVKKLGVQWFSENGSKFLAWAYPHANWPGIAKSKLPQSVATPAPAPMPAPPPPAPQAVAKAKSLFDGAWKAGEAATRNLWGPSFTAPMQEAYKESPGGYRLVQYYDKGRMELTDPTGTAVTRGLLATELITGQIQIGADAFQSRDPAKIPIAGDADSPGPTYASLNGRTAKVLAATQVKTGEAITLIVAATGDVTEGGPTAADPSTAAKTDTTLNAYDATTRHNLPAAFAAYRAKVGVAVIGYAKSEPFVATVKVGGKEQHVVVQIFERRVLTYTASNPEPFKVEMGNIGRHYHQWRYG